tara:strand:- start:17 stop:148 length:132 start_codon:yes stop_codon:yes gene_type:complete
VKSKIHSNSLLDFYLKPISELENKKSTAIKGCGFYCGAERSEV